MFILQQVHMWGINILPPMKHEARKTLMHRFIRLNKIVFQPKADHPRRM